MLLCFLSLLLLLFLHPNNSRPLDLFAAQWFVAQFAGSSRLTFKDQRSFSFALFGKWLWWQRRKCNTDVCMNLLTQFADHVLLHACGAGQRRDMFIFVVGGRLATKECCILTTFKKIRFSCALEMWQFLNLRICQLRQWRFLVSLKEILDWSPVKTQI